MRNIFEEFKAFISRGNVVDLAVAVVVGLAFTAVVNSFVDDILMQIVAIVFGKPNFSSLYVTINDSQIRFGAFFTAVINFLIIAFAVFLVVKAINALQNLRRRQGPAVEAPAASDEVVLLTQIRDLLARPQPGGPARY